MAYKRQIEWIWVQDRELSAFRCITDTQFIVCYDATNSEEQHDIELEKFQKDFPMAQVYQERKKST